MTATLRVPASRSLCASATALREVTADPSAVRAAARAAGEAWVESVLDGFVLPVAAAARGRPAGRRTAAAARDLADGLIGAGTRRLDGAATAAFVDFLDERLAVGPPPTIAVPIEPPLAAALTHLTSSAPAAPAALADALHATIDAGLAGLLDEPLALLPLGLVARTAARVGRAAIAHRVHGEVDRAVADLDAANRLRALLLGYLPPG